MNQKKVIQNKIVFSLNENDKTCCVIGNDSASGKIFIPRLIKYDEKEFIITTIKEGSFKGSQNIKSLHFPPDSLIRKIEKNAFEESSIQSITIPSSLTELENGWCSGTSNLIKVTVAENNQYYKNYEEDEKIIIGKSDITNNEYDILVFACRNSRLASIPSNIRQISSYCFASSYIKRISIPKKVTHICEYAFDQCICLESIEIPHDSLLQTIERCAFSGCNFDTFSIPSSLTNLNECCFAGMYAAEKINIMKSEKQNIIEYDNKFIVRKSDNDQFDTLVFTNHGFSNVIIPSNIKQIFSHAFQFSKIESITIPSSVKVLKKGWCANTSNLKEVKINEKNPNYKNFEKFIIGKSDINSDEYDVLVFACRDIKTATIPSSIKQISSYSFSNSLIEKVFIPSNITDIDECAFLECSNLKCFEISADSKLKKLEKFVLAYTSVEKVVIPSQINEICEDAFCYCENLKTVEFSSDAKLEKIDQFAFNRSSIEKIIIPSNIKQIEKFAFYLCDKLKTIEIPPDSKLQMIEKDTFTFTLIDNFVVHPFITSICENAFNTCQRLTTITIPPNSELKTIGKNAFCDSCIERIYIPKSVIELKDGWCAGTQNLKEVIIDPNNKYYKNYDNQIIVGKSDINKDIYDILVFVNRNTETVSIPPNIKTIAPFSFQMSSIRNIFIPSKIKQIGESSFDNCINLENVVFENDSELEMIGERAFSFAKIESILIPPHVTKICYDSFKYCPNLQEVNFHKQSKVQIIEENAFYDSCIERIYIPKSVIELKDDWCAETPNLKEVIIDPNNKYYKNYDNQIIVGKSDINKDIYDILVFVNRNTETVSIPPNIKIIAPYAFSKCSIKNILIPSQVIKICELSFSQCNKLKYVEIPRDSKLQIIEEFAFNLSQIKSFFIPRSIKKLNLLSFVNNRIQIIEVDANIDIQSIYFDIHTDSQPIIMISNI